MPYDAPVSRTNPSCILFLIDQSTSMAEPMNAGDTETKKMDGVADVVNKFLQSLIIRCAAGKGEVLPYYYVGLIGYGFEVGPAFGGQHAGKELVCVSDLPAAARQVTKVKQTPDGPETIRSRVWYDAYAGGTTPMCEALRYAGTVLQKFVTQYPSSHPPMVVNVTDGEATDGDPTADAQALQQIRTSDGSVLLFNIHISAEHHSSIVFPNNENALPDQLTRMLFRMSSQIPPKMLAIGKELRMGIAEGARGFAFNAELSCLTSLLEIGTRGNALAPKTGSFPVVQGAAPKPIAASTPPAQAANYQPPGFQQPTASGLQSSALPLPQVPHQSEYVQPAAHQPAAAHQPGRPDLVPFQTSIKPQQNANVEEPFPFGPPINNNQGFGAAPQPQQNVSHQSAPQQYAPQPPQPVNHQPAQHNQPAGTGAASHDQNSTSGGYPIAQTVQPAGFGMASPSQPSSASAQQNNQSAAFGTAGGQEQDQSSTSGGYPVAQTVQPAGFGLGGSPATSGGQPYVSSGQPAGFGMGSPDQGSTGTVQVDGFGLASPVNKAPTGPQPAGFGMASPDQSSTVNTQPAGFGLAPNVTGNQTTGNPLENAKTSARIAFNNLTPGSTIADKYLVEAMLGKGGMAVVCKARHLLMDRLVAIKMLLPEVLEEADAVQRFVREAKSASNLKHPNIVTIYDFGHTPEGLPYLVMDLLHGRSLDTILEEEGKLSAKRAVPIIAQVCEALAVAHRSNIVHRDIKPSNVMIEHMYGQDDFVQLVDFGIAKAIEAGGNDKLTKTGEIFGSLLYMSPEQCMGKQLDHRADIYAVGCVIYELLTGSCPFKGASVYQTMSNHVNGDPPDLMAHCEAFPNIEKFDLVYKKAVAKTPSERYQSTLELKADLVALI